MSVVTLGSVFMDIKGYPDDSFVPEGRNAGHVEYVFGGVSRNIAENIANIGLPSVFVGLVDDTGMGEEVIRDLEQHGVDTAYIRKVHGGMGTWLAVFDSRNDVCASISQRPNLRPILDILRERGDELVAGADSVLLELDLDEKTVRKVFELCKKHGKPVYAAVSNIRMVMKSRELLGGVSCFVCNLEEAGVLFARNLSGEEPALLAKELAGYIRDAGIASMVVTMGERGAVWAQKTGACGICPSRRVKVMDTTGAGDAFFSGVAAGLTYGRTLAEACEIGTRLSSTVITTLHNTCPRFQPEEFGLGCEPRTGETP